MLVLLILIFWICAHKIFIASYISSLSAQKKKTIKTRHQFKFSVNYFRGKCVGINAHGKIEKKKSNMNKNYKSFYSKINVQKYLLLLDKIDKNN